MLTVVTRFDKRVIVKSRQALEKFDVKIKKISKFLKKIKNYLKKIKNPPA